MGGSPGSAPCSQLLAALRFWSPPQELAAGCPPQGSWARLAQGGPKHSAQQVALKPELLSSPSHLVAFHGLVLPGHILWCSPHHEKPPASDLLCPGLPVGWCNFGQVRPQKSDLQNSPGEGRAWPWDRVGGPLDRVPAPHIYGLTSLPWLSEALAVSGGASWEGIRKRRVSVSPLPLKHPQQQPPSTAQARTHLRPFLGLSTLSFPKGFCHQPSCSLCPATWEVCTCFLVSLG